MKKDNWNFDLYKHQEEGISKLIENKNFALWSEMGLGKTCQALYAFDSLLESNEAKRMLVVMPNTSKIPWKQEIEKAFIFPPSYQIIGSKDKIISSGEILIINYENITRRRYDLRDYLEQSGISILVCDECQDISSNKAQRTKTAHWLASFAERKWALSGTPVPKRIESFWSPMKFLGAIDESYWNFLRKYCYLGNRFSPWAIVGYKTERLKELEKINAKVSVRHLKEDCLDLPDRVFNYLYCEMSPQQKRIYKEMKKDLSAWVNSLDAGQYRVEAANVLTQLLRLNQIASHPNSMGIELDEDPGKLLTLDKYLEDYLPEGKALIWSNYYGSIDSLSKRYETIYGAQKMDGRDSLKDRERILRRFRSNPGSRILILNPGVGKTSLTLTEAHLSIYYDRTFRTTDYLQSLDRNHRISQTKKVTVVILMHEGIDEYIDDTINRDLSHSDTLLGETRAVVINRETLMEFLLRK